MITIKVHNQSNGNPAKGKKVVLGFGFGRGVTEAQWTDERGEAHFDADNGDGEVYVDGSTKHKGYLSGRIVIYI